MRRLAPLPPLSALAAVLLLLSTTAAMADTLEERLDAILNRHDTDAIYSARVIRLSDGKELYARGIDRPMIPASNMKLPVSSAALDHFGSGATFKTYLGMSADDLVVVGTGDPGLGDPRIAEWHDEDRMAVFDRWAEALKEKGVTQVKGDLIYDDHALPKPWVHPTWDSDDLVYWYAAPVSGLTFNDNCIDVTARPGEMGGKPELEVIPATTDTVHIVNLGRTTQESGERLEFERTPNATVFALTGDVHTNREINSRPVTDPGAFFADVLRTRLKEKGLTITGKTRRAEQAINPDSVELVATHESKMPDLLKRINTNSQNLFAEAFSKLLGKAVIGEATWEAGDEAVKKFMEANDIDPTRFKGADGSGLSRENRVTVRQLTELMRLMHTHRDAETFRESLSVGGESGTLSSRFKDAPGDVRGKTGFIGGVRALTVYATPDGEDETYVVSVLWNDIPGSVKPFETLQDEAIVEVMKTAGQDEASASR